MCKLNLAAIEFAGISTSAKDWTYERNIHRIVTDLPCPIETSDDVCEWLEKTESHLPVLLENMRTIAGLDALVNDGSVRLNGLDEPTLAHFDSDTGFSRLVLAHLVGNPAFDQMVAETAGACRVDPSGVHRVVEYLKRNVNAES